MTQYNDRRQAVLSRLDALLSDIGPIVLLGGPNGATTIAEGNYVLNRNALPENLVPGIILMDADEVRNVRQTQPPPGMAQRGVSDQVMSMTPEIYIVLDVRKPQNENVGADLNTARLAILAAVLPDTGLWNIVGANGNIVYDGCVTDLARNRLVQGQMGISITFSYPLKRTEYVGV
jgi:hypothetical protein